MNKNEKKDPEEIKEEIVSVKKNDSMDEDRNQ